MSIKKTALASAISLALVSGSVWANCPAAATAPSTTCSAQFIFDRTTVDAGKIVNVSLLGLDENGIIDRLGEQRGAVIFVTISSGKGQVVGGSQTPGERAGDADPKAGEFAISNNPAAERSNTRSIRLNQGLGRAYIYYPPGTSGSDTVTLTLRARTGSNSATFTNLSDSFSKTIQIKPANTDAEGLDIISFTGAQTSDTTPSDGIAGGAMIAGVAGAQVTVKAIDDNGFDKNANGLTTLTLKGSKTYTFTQQMISGEAVFTLDDTVQKAGLYFIEAVFTKADGEKVSSVDLVHEDKVNVFPTGEVRGLMLSSDKQRISRTAAAGNEATIKVNLLDVYGNATSNAKGSLAGQSVTVAVKDANAVVADFDIVVPPSGSATYMLGNAAAQIKKPDVGGTATLKGTPISGANREVVSSVAPSGDVTVQLVEHRLTATPLFTTPQAVGTEFNAFTVINSTPTNPNPGTLTITNMGSKESISVNRNSDGSNIIKALFSKATTKDEYLISDNNGLLGEYVVKASGLIAGPATAAKFVNSHNVEETTIGNKLSSDGQTYDVMLPPSAIKLFDASGNAVSAGSNTVTISSANGTVTGGTVTPGIAGNSVKIAYATTGGSKFSGEDTLKLAFTNPGIKAVPSISTTVKALPVLTTIKTYLEGASFSELPFNAEVAMSIDVLDQDGNLFKAQEPVRLELNPTGNETLPTPFVSLLPGTTQLASGTNLNNASNSHIKTYGSEVLVIKAGQDEGTFSVQLSDAAKTASATVQRAFNVSKAFTAPVCGPTNLPACTTKEDCNGAGGSFIDNVCQAADPGELADVTGSSTRSDGSTTATFKGGISVAGEAFTLSGNAALSQNVVVRGSIVPETADVGKTGNIVVAGIHTSNIYPAGFRWYQLDGSTTNVVILPTADGSNLPDLTQLKYLSTDVTLTNPYTFDMYAGKFVYGGPLSIFFGYEVMDNGNPRVVFTSAAIGVTITTN